MAEHDPSFLVLTPPAAAHVAEGLQATAVSPLRVRADAPSVEAAERALASRAVRLDGPPTAEDPYRQALDVIAQPEALVRVRVVEPGQEPSDVAVLVKGGAAAPFLFDDGTLLVGPARPLEAIAASLAGQAGHDGPLSGQQILVWPATLKVLTLVWGRDQDASKRIARAEAERRLAGEGRSAETVAKAIDELVAGGVILAAGDGLEIVEAYRPFLDRVWSGHALQIEFLPVLGAPSLDAVLVQTGPRLLFVGPAGDRILNDPVTGEALARWLDGAPAAEPKAIRLAAPPAEVRTKLVRLLLGLERSPVAKAAR
ncbi:MAG: hypothetical protein ABW221_21225 [Vicinamibacteria bacterium]